MTELTDKERLSNLENKITEFEINLTNAIDIINKNFESLFKYVAPQYIKVPGFIDD